MTTARIPPPIFLTADWHVGHANVIAYDRRPFRDVGEMLDALVRNYREVVTVSDSVLFLGDMFFKASKSEALSIMSSLPGQKSLILGNHDRHSKTWYRDVGFDVVLDYAIATDARIGDVLFVHDPLHAVRCREPYQAVVHGHKHSVGPQMRGAGSGLVEVSVTAWDYRPAMFDDVVDLLVA